MKTLLLINPRQSPAAAIALEGRQQMNAIGNLESRAVVESDSSAELISCGPFTVGSIPQFQEEMLSLATDPIRSTGA